ncbi:class I SAM-dependent methyltransferase [Paenibacillus glycanilyticus]|uniref:Methyltransferase n=1 Tax=Paenibacillus glycanilyticus TaxID=126569 RepID=A0ABQ6GCL5_9BACL|nr:class I SAM-dependent methyltransferase [Paenibacillus glycanilyticus]GLX68015.1 methyltransferase [Paenibacillus glycanilyticus]
MEETIQSIEDVLTMLDALLKEQSTFNWDAFYSDREKPIPFFANTPDENLVQYVQTNLLRPGRALDLGCGPGRNAIFLAKEGWNVDAVDISAEAIGWANDRAYESNVQVNFIQKDLFDLDLEPESYDLIYDSGCFHYVPPHRRMSYLNIIKKALKPDGAYAITCFKVGGKYGGSDLSDWEVYRQKSLRGGLGYTKEKLAAIFHDFDLIELREMKEIEQPASVFGSNSLLTGLFNNKRSCDS